eukprot:720533-Pyramimonas_sp.AAC.1
MAQPVEVEIHQHPADPLQETIHSLTPPHEVVEGEGRPTQGQQQLKLSLMISLTSGVALGTS